MLKFDNKILTDENYDEYKQYFESIKPLLPKDFVKCYEEPFEQIKHNRFHDATVVSIAFEGKSFFYKNTYDSVILRLNMGKYKEYVLEFRGITKLNLCYTDRNSFLSCDGKSIYGEIIDCILGLVEKDKFFIQIETSTEVELLIEFKKVRVKTYFIR